MVVFFSSLLWCVCVVGEGNNSEPELVWGLYESEPAYRAKGIVRCDDGGFVMAAERYVPPGDDQIGGGPIVGVELVKIAGEGVVQWRVIHGEGYSPLSIDSIVNSGDGGYVLALRKGFSCQDAGSSIPCLVKFDSLGRLVWEKEYTDSSLSSLSSLSSSEVSFLVVALALL